MTVHPAADGEFAVTGGYLDTAAYGLAPRRAVAAVQQALGEWRSGAARWPVDWDPAGDDCRALLATLVGTAVDHVALLPAVSVGVGIVASALRPGDEVLVADDEFASLLLPLVAAEGERDVRLRRVPYERLAEAVTDRTALVAASHVRSNGGGLIDLDALVAAARAAGALTLIDATHSAGVLPLDARERGLDFVVAAAYKHLLCPRGVAFLAVAPERLDQLVPRCASWRAQVDPYDDYFGGGLDKLAAGAARLDVSLAWFSWLGARESLALLAAVPADERAQWCVGLADRLAEALDIEPTGSSVLGVPVRGERGTVAAALAAAGVTATCGNGTVRASFHLYNGEADVELAASALAQVRDPVRIA